jgi:ankyrin repeat protein
MRTAGSIEKEAAVPSRRLPDKPSFEHLRNQAKALRRQVLEGNSAALALIHEFHPRLASSSVDVSPSTDVSPSNDVSPRLPLSLARERGSGGEGSFALADAQFVIARQYGFPSWRRLRQHVELIERYTRQPHRQPVGSPITTPGELTDEFLRLACLTYGGDDPARWEQARALLAAHPDLSTASIYTMAAVGEVAAANALLANDPTLANRQGGPHQWEPLLYLAYSRLNSSEPGHSALDVARLLLAHGADPNAGYLWDGLPSPFTALTGALGEGEDAVNQPPHQDGMALARLLLDAGADPNDSQALYNRQFRSGLDHLELLFEYGLGTGSGGPWHARLAPRHQTPAEMVQDQLLWAALTDQPERVRLLLAYGVEVDGYGSRHPVFRGRTAYELAVLNGNAEIAALLQAAGAGPGTIDPVEHFLAACLRVDRPEVDRLLAADPTLLARATEREPHAIVRAAERGRPDAVRLLAGLGFDVNGGWRGVPPRMTPLHQAAYAGSLEIVKLLLDLGADPSIPDQSYNAPALGWARHNQQHAVVAYLEALTP